MKMNDKKFQSIITLPGPQRYVHFVKAVAGWGRAWGLFDDGWAAMGTGDGTITFPLWPAEEFAAALVREEWSHFSPRSIDVHDILDEIMPRLRKDGEFIAVFPTPQQKGVIPELNQLEHDLREELARVE